MSNGPFTDEMLARMAKEGDREAFEDLFNKYKRQILNFIYRLIGNKETAEEVTQEVFVKAYLNLDIFDPAKKFATWIYTIARNLSKNALRDKKYFRDVSMEQAVSGEGEEQVRLKDVLRDPHPQPDVVAQDDELAEQAQKVLDSMPLEYREAIVLCGVQGMTVREAAEVLKTSPASVSIRMAKAKELFMKRVGLTE